MKRLLFTTLFLLALMVSLVGTASAAPMASGVVTLQSVHYDPAKGAVFIFSVSDKFSKSELKGTIGVQGGGTFTVHCAQKDEGTVSCNAPKKVAGHNVWITWGGSTFWAYVPEAPIFCYGVYDWNADMPYTEWVNYGEYCQERAPHYGDMITWYNPGWEASFDYVFLPESPSGDWCTFTSVYGDAYYYPNCPGSLPY